ncbi:MAG: RNA polymerase sigma factor [Flavobacteriales bacterium]|nr:RNA polymerase sigma factor [Flavobacteriales bacterium]
MQAQNDEYYIEQVRGGNIAAFETLINRYKGMTMNLAIRIVRNREDAEEVAQDAFLKAFKAIHDFRSDSRFSTWLYSIVYRTAVSKTRKKIIDTADIDDHLISDKIAVHIDDQLEEMKATERKHYLRKALDELAQDESALLTLYYLEEQSVEEIVQITGLTESNVKTKLYRARKKLMLILEGMLKNEIRSIL